VVGVEVMRGFFQRMSLVASACLMGCSGVSAQKNPYELYDLHPASQVDNDSYYTPPKGRSNCMTIGDMPSCTDF
jgi:hypothetical protein